MDIYISMRLLCLLFHLFLSPLILIILTAFNGAYIEFLHLVVSSLVERFIKNLLLKNLIIII